MRKLKLKNGITLLLEEKDTESVAINATIMTGSIKEDDTNRGISHFIEHMIFEGTKNRTALQIANEIEGLGGTIGAYTSAERTCFYVKVLKKHVKSALEVISDILMNPLFDKKAIEKERTVVLSEIKMNKDQPRLYQWSLFQRTLFRIFPLKHPVIGYSDIVKKLTQKDLFDYFNKHYTGNNIVISIVGKISGVENEIKQAFTGIQKKTRQKIKFDYEKPRKSPTIKKEKRPISQTYLVLGYLAATRQSRDSYVFDIIHSILGRGISGRLFDELRTKRGLGYDVGAYYSDNRNYGFFAAYASVDKKNLDLTKKLILDNIRKIDKLTGKELNEAKRYIEGEFILHNEDTQNLADNLCFYEHIDDAGMMNDYIKNIKKVKISDITRVKKKYFNNNYSLIVLEQEK